jgi:hypothetical protein
MSISLRVRIAEDAEDDALLLVRELARRLDAARPGLRVL